MEFKLSNSTRKRVGLYGGAFDPVHAAHLAVAQSCIKEDLVEEVWFLVDEEPRGKQTKTSYAHRVQMIKKIVGHLPHYKVDELDIQKSPTTHDHNSILKLRNQFPDNQFFVILGEDAAAKFDYWEKPEVFCSNCDFIIAKRSGYDGEFTAMRERLSARDITMQYSLIDVRMPHISSTIIRRELAGGLIPKKLLPGEIHDYILENQLYT